MWKLFTPDLPIWANGVECEICKASFESAEHHYHFAKQSKLLTTHEGCVPVIRRKR